MGDDEDDDEHGGEADADEEEEEGEDGGEWGLSIMCWRSWCFDRSRGGFLPRRICYYVAIAYQAKSFRFAILPELRCLVPAMMRYYLHP